MKRALLLSATGVTAFVLLASGALASSLQDVYDEVRGVQNVVESGGVAPTTTGALPFTGVELGLVVAAGLLLVVAGLALRRTARQRA